MAHARSNTRLEAPLAAALCALAFAGCLTSKFDGLSGGGSREHEEDDASVLVADGGMDAEQSEPELDADEPDDEGTTAALDGARAADAADSSDAALDGATIGPSDAGKDAAPRADAEAGTPTCANSTPRTLRAASEAIELARLRVPSGVASRVLGPTVQLGSARIWTFESLRLSTEGTRPAQRPTNYPSSARDGASAPWTKTTPTSDWQLSEVLGANNLPESLLTLNVAEQSASDVTLFISTLLPDPAQPNNAVGFAKEAIGFFAPLSQVWLVNLTSGGSMATRGSQPLFQAPEPLFGHAAVRDGAYFKLFGCGPGAPDAGADSAYPCLVARVPIARVGERAAYEFYTRDTFGMGMWTSDVARAAPVVNVTGFALSVSFNAYLQKFLMVYSEGTTNDAALRAAPTPEGPWSEPVLVKQSAGRYWFNFNTREQESLAQNCGKRIIVSTWSPLDGATLPDGAVVFPTTGDVVLSAIELQ